MKYNTIANLLMLILFAIIFTSSGMAQDSKYQEEVQKAIQQLNKGNFTKAEEIFKAAIKIDDKKNDAYIGLGYINYVKKDYNKAKDWYVKALDIDPNDIFSHYQLAICDRERAKFRDPVSRWLIWKSAKKHFLKVIQIDSTYKDVYNEYANLKFLQRDYVSAIDLCLKQLNINPDSRKASADIFKFYDFFLIYTDPDMADSTVVGVSDQITWLKSRHTKYDVYFLGEKYRRTGRYAEADSIFRKLLKQKLPFSKTPVYLSRVRLLYETNRPVDAEKVYWQCLDNIRYFKDLTFLYNDIKYMMSDSDLQVHLPNLKAIKKYYHHFWNRNNPYPGSKYNLRMEEHYKRLIYAEKYFRYDGPRLEINNPDRERSLVFPEIYYRNSHFNDKGLVYIRYGPPDEKALSMGPDFPSNESWLYHATNFNKKLIFHFEIHRDANPNDWRLVGVPSTQEMIESRLGWDNKLDQYYMARTDLELQSARTEAQMDARVKIKKAMSDERPAVLENSRFIPLYVTAGSFLDDAGEAYLDVYTATPLKEMFAGKSNPDSCYFEIGIAVQDTFWNNISKKTENIAICKKDSSQFYNGFYLDRFKVYPQGELFYLAVHVQDTRDQALSGIKVKFKAKNFPDSSLSMSDILTAEIIEPSTKVTKFSHNGLDIIPNPTMKFDRKKPVYFYYEIYNLPLVEKKSDYTIEKTIIPVSLKKNIFQKFIGLFKKSSKQKITIRDEMKGDKKNVDEYMAFDFTDKSPGKYQINIIITDNLLGQTCHSIAEFEIY